MKSFFLFGVVCCFFLLRVVFLWLHQSGPAYFYSDSCSHILNGLWHIEGNVPWRWSWRFFPLAGTLFGLTHKAGIDLYWASICVNGLFGLGVLACLFHAVKRWADDFASVITCVLVVLYPAFPKLVLSGQPEMTALLMVCLALWILLFRGTTKDRRRLGVDIAIVSFLGLAMFARAESAGLLFAVIGLLLVQWRKDKALLAVLATYCVALVWWRFPSLFGHSLKAFEGNQGVLSPGWAFRLMHIPRWLWDGGILLLIAGLAGSAVLWSGMRRWEVRWIYLLAILQFVFLWGASWFNLFSMETDRNFMLVLLLTAIPAGVAISERFSWMKRRAILFSVLVVALASGWVLVSKQERADVYPGIERQRNLGLMMKTPPYPHLLDRDSAVLIYEASDGDWPNFCVFSGCPQRIRLVSSLDVEWGRKQVWRGDEPFGLVVLSSTTVPESIRPPVIPVKLLETRQENKFYRPPRRGYEDRVE
ncbi:MAG TPA: hypothetical protein PK876_02430 [Elusimicrobiota bacterium]|nr:hypothetical protein [Elusimicrobiota bacterium]